MIVSHTQGVWAKFDSFHKRKRTQYLIQNLTVFIKGKERNILFKNKSILKNQNILTRLWLLDNCLLKVDSITFNHSFKMALEAGTHVPYCVPGKIFWRLIYLVVVGRAVSIFLNHAPHIVIHRIRRPEIGAVKVIDIFWRYGKKLNPSVTHMAF